MEAKENNPCPLGQELESKASELVALRRMREEQLVDLTLRRIVDGVVSKEAEITDLMTVTKGQCANGLREIVEREVIRSADGLLWCREYEEQSRSGQQMSVYTGSHWEAVEPQQ